jgi:hypothetical protein
MTGARLFISHVAEDTDFCLALARGLESEGYKAWYYEEHSLPGVSYVDQILEAIAASGAVLVILSDAALGSQQVDIEIVRAHETGKTFLPLLKGLSHDEFRARRPNWAMMMGASVALPMDERALLRSLPRIVQGLKHLGIGPDAADGGRPIAELVTETGRSSGSPMASTPPLKDKALTFSHLKEIPSALVGNSLGDYSILEYIGSGGSGWVYRARHGTLGKEACVKVLYPLETELEPLVRSLAAGIRALAALDHPNVIKVHAFNRFVLSDGVSFFIAMDFIDGTSLNRWSPPEGRNLPGLRSRLTLAVKIAVALDAAHHCRYFDESGFERMGLLHGDVKPSNVIIRRNREPVLTDFMVIDIQRALDRRYRLNIRNVEGDYHTGAFGTPGFMAPEQEQSGIVTVRTDIYSLGVTLFTLIPINMEEWGAAGTAAGQWPDLLSAMTNSSPGARPCDVRTVVKRLKAILRSLG